MIKMAYSYLPFAFESVLGKYIISKSLMNVLFLLKA